MSKLNCGIIGGRPKEAYYLVGVQEDSLILLDPHTTQQTLNFDDIKTNWINFHESQAKKFQFNRLDPSMTFAFYLRSAEEFTQFKIWHDKQKTLFDDFWLFSALDSKPNFLKSAAFQAEIFSKKTEPKGEANSKAQNRNEEESKQENSKGAQKDEESDDGFDII